MMPIAIKKQLAANMADGFVLKRAVFSTCLELYPLKEWEQLMEKVNRLNRFNKKNNDFIRRFTAGVKTVEMDASGRLLIPKDLVNYASISKEVVVSSNIQDLVRIKILLVLRSCLLLTFTYVFKHSFPIYTFFLNVLVATLYFF